MVLTTDREESVQAATGQAGQVDVQDQAGRAPARGRREELASGRKRLDDILR